MKTENYSKDLRILTTQKLSADLVVIGGGLSGVCAAIAAARSGIKVILVQDRPVLGGNASSEVRLWVLGATSHMGNNNRWSREGGIIDEILVENLYRNKEGNPVIFDTVILDKVKAETNITLLLNTAVFDIRKSSGGDKMTNKITNVIAFNSQTSNFYEISGSIFCDASGDGIVGYLAGASYRMGAEDKLTYGEKFAPDPGDYGELLGHSLYFYSKDTGKPVKYVAPSYALKDITAIPRFRNIRSDQHGCKFWWLEYGGRRDTIQDTEDIKWELWRVVYGVWDHIKNSGQYPDAENLTLEWVGIIPGKRESRRFEGHYTLVQQDIIEQRHHPDAVLFGGWAIDLHPADGVYSEKGGCIQYHSKGIYEIPYRCFVSKDIRNLYFAGRNISASHVAHGSSRVMATTAFGGQAVGFAAAQCIKKGLLPADLIAGQEIKALQEQLNRAGQSIPHTTISLQGNKASTAIINASSCLLLNRIPFDGPWRSLDFPAAQMLPLRAGQAYRLEVQVEASSPTRLDIELRHAGKPENYTPGITIEKQTFELGEGIQMISIDFAKGLPADQYGFITFLRNEHVRIRMSNERYTGILSVFNTFNHAVNNYGKQEAPENSGIDSFEFWCPDRRPQGHNIAMNISPAIDAFAVGNLLNGSIRPTVRPNAWAAALTDVKPEVNICWEVPQLIRNIYLYFDTDYDHALESVQMGHPENIIPFCVQRYSIWDDNNRMIYEKTDNYQTINKITFGEPVQTCRLKIVLEQASKEIPVSLFQLYID